MKPVKIVFAAIALFLVGLIFNTTKNENDGHLLPLAEVEDGLQMNSVEADVPPPPPIGDLDGRADGAAF